MRTSPALAAVFSRVLLASMGASALASSTGCGAAVRPSDGGDTDAVVPDTNACAPTMTTEVCDVRVTWTCDAPVAPNQVIPRDQCAALCPPRSSGTQSPSQCVTTSEASGAVTLDCTYCAIGRRTEGLTEPACQTPASASAVGAFLAHHAMLEAASVLAFERLRDELRAHGAPDSLLDALAIAADEERDHAERVGRAALARGATPPPVQLDAVAPRSLLAIARENAAEGCVRETLGALTAQWQSIHADDRDLAELYARLADDELRHAKLSWRLDAWFAGVLTDAQRGEVAAAKREAVRGLYAGLEHPMEDALVRAAGLPDAAAIRAMLDGLSTELWDA
jgi:hypothetical protein